MDEQVLEKVKECAITYLGVKRDDIVTVSEISSDAGTQSFDVKLQGRDKPKPESCIVMVKDGQARIVSGPEPGAP